MSSCEKIFEDSILAAALLDRLSHHAMITPWAVVVPKNEVSGYPRVRVSDRTTASAELAELIRAKIAGYKVPDRIELMEMLPRTPLMKIDRGTPLDTIRYLRH